ncbi:PDR/VanB family oxidoreductase [Gordonia sp. NPDC058843]|uniref:PDR/VanB family oxidoreductase n=1 Tax=Gordonia sp. NPDC058843 TaxID=3346648 RepID=UPI0036D0F899
MSEGLTATEFAGDAKLRVAAKQVEAEGVVSLTLVDPDGKPLPSWEPGAHLDLILGDDLIRQYSLCGDVNDRDRLRVAVLREPAGRGGSSRVHDELAVGDLVAVKGPRNNFPLVDAPAYLFVAGGIGITPLKPMIAEVDGRGAEWTLLYGGRTSSGMAFGDVLAQSHPQRVGLRPQDEYGLLDLDRAIAGVPAGTAVYCCGPEPLLSAIEEACRIRPDIELHVERFAPKTTLQDNDSTGGPFDVVLDRSGRTVTVSPGDTVLDALLDDGLDVDFSCREGTCGTCEQVVLEGVPDHRDSVLSEDEQASNDCMMVCVSRSRTPRLVLDL